MGVVPVSSFVEDHAQGIHVRASVHVRGRLNVACSGAMYSGEPATVPSRVNSVRSVNCSPPIALARPKSITLGTGLPSWLSTRMLLGLRVAMDDALLVRVLHGGTDLDEQPEPGGNRHLVLVAVLVERDNP